MASLALLALVVGRSRALSEPEMRAEDGSLVFRLPAGRKATFEFEAEAGSEAVVVDMAALAGAVQQLQRSVTRLETADAEGDSSFTAATVTVRSARNGCEGTTGRQPPVATLNGESLLRGGLERGLTLIALGVSPLQPQAPRHFDTFDSPADAAAMAAYIDALPVGTVVLVLSSDAEAKALSEAAHAALASLGAARSRLLRLREAYALIGRKGAAVGTVPEDLGSVPGKAPPANGCVPFAPRDTVLLEQTFFGGPVGAAVEREVERRVARAATALESRSLDYATVEVQSVGRCAAGEGGSRLPLLRYNGARVPHVDDEPRGIHLYVVAREGFSNQTVFDTHGNGRDASQDMLTFVRSLPVGTDVVAFVYDSGENMAAAGVEALRMLGAARAGTILFRQAYAQT